MDISTDIQQGIHIITVSGKIDAGSVALLDNEVKRVIAVHAQKILFDFSQAIYINSSGLRVVLATAKIQKNSGGTFALCGVTEEINKIFSLAGFTAILMLYPTKTDAIARMASKADT